MSPIRRDHGEERILVLAPVGRDSQVVAEVLARAEIAALDCSTIEELCSRWQEGAGALLIAEEALTAPALAIFSQALHAQPPWSDIPIVIMTGAGETSEAQVRAIRALDPSGNVTVLERPVRVFTMIVTVQAALRARRRQYEMRDLLAQLQLQMERLQIEKELRARFVSLLAHDLRGPLAAATMAVALLEKTMADDGVSKNLVRARRNLDRIEKMIRDLLDVSRIQAGHRLTLALDSHDLTSIIEEVAEDLNTIHGERIRVDIPEGIHGFWSADELRRAIWNLASNAIKYGARDRPVTIAVRRDGELVELSVHNEGAPLSREELEEIFEPFARAKPAQLAGTIGWGLGLTLVRGCAEAHGGTVRVSSTTEQGTTFTLRLPIDARPFQPQPPAAPAKTAGDQSPNPRPL